MRRLLAPLAAGLASVALITAALVLTLSGDAPESAPPGEIETAPASAPSALAELPPAPLPETLRNVTPGGILPLPPVTGPLTRIAPRLPELPAREIPTEVTFRQPVVLDGGTLRTGGLTIRLAGIEAPALDETCPSRLGGAWPCGVRARTALRALVRGYAITCGDLQEQASGLILATCRRDTVDLAGWLVRQGWAVPAADADPAMVEAAQAARDARRGRWQLEGLPARAGADGAAPDEPADGLEDGRPLLDVPAVEIIDTPWHPANRD